MMMTMRKREAVLTVILTVTGLSLGLRSMEDLEEDVEVSVNISSFLTTSPPVIISLLHIMSIFHNF